MRALLYRLALFFIRFRHFSFMAACAALGVVLFFQPQRNQDQSIEGMFAMDDQLFSSFQVLKRTFDGSEVILVVYRDPQLMNPDGQRRQEIFTDNINRVRGISGQAISLQSLLRMIEQMNLDQMQTMLKLAGFDLSTAELVEKSKKLFEGFTHSRDGKTASIVILLEPGNQSGIPRGTTVDAIRESVEQAREEAGLREEVMLVGESVMVTDGFRMVQEDGRRLGRVATIALSLVVLVLFRSLRWTLIPVALVQCSLVASEAIVAMLHIQVTIVGSMSTSIITVIAVSTIVHLIVRIRKNLTEGMEYGAATERAFLDLATPITFACLTDAVGFGALWFAELEPVQDFATVMFTGSLMVLATFWLVVPTLALFSTTDRIPFWNLKVHATGFQSTLTRCLSLLQGVSEKSPVLTLALTGLLLFFSLGGTWQNSVESDFTKNFRADSEIVRSYSFVEDNLGGAGVWDVMIRAPQELDVEFLLRVQSLQNRLRTEIMAESEMGEEPGLTKVLSLVDAIESFSGRGIEDLSKTHLQLGLMFLEQKMPQFGKALVSSDPLYPGHRYYRIMLRSRERTPADEKKKIIREVRAICSDEFPDPPGNPEEPQTRTTGFYVLLAYMIDSVIRDQWTTFGIAAAGILLMLVISIRSLPLALIGMLPNLLPVFFVLGLLGWLAIPLNLGIALIAAVALGLSIDSSIHYLFDFQQKRKSMDWRAAVGSVQDQVGRALVYSTIALVMGFLSLCLSDFLPTVYFGATAVIAMIGGLLGNLFLLPFFLCLLCRRSNP